MTSKTRREFTEEFKREAVLLLESSGRPLMQVAREFGIHPSMLRNWRARGHGPTGPTAGAAGTGRILLPASPAQAEIRRLQKELERAQVERDILKESHRHLLGPAEMKFRFIEEHRKTFLVRVMCSVLEVSTSGYYAWRRLPESIRSQASRALLGDIRRIHTESLRRFGSPRVHPALKAEGQRWAATVWRA